MTRPLVIFGAGSLARLAHYYATHEMGLRVLGFVVDADRKNIDTCCGLPVFSWEACPAQHPPASTSMYVAVGYREMRQRQRLFDRAKAAGYGLQNIVSTSGFLAATVQMGENNFIMPGAVVEPGVRLGNNNVVWSNTTLCHDTVVGHHNFFASNVTVGGEVTVGDRCFFGFTSTVVHQRRVGDDVLLAAQSLLLDDGEPLGWYQGVPAKRVESISEQTGVCVK
ncbi:acetyltransferase [Methylomonas sp. MO1]|uniref:acetyltransferase n=1 Tax=unclassified Methylomonas TaxID=2608980 RepID=UPI00047D83DB|nr:MULTISPECIES: acetyltransferase [unclassified Methylomonas]MDT4291150.1 acetyltransferase [Methylomonas sp. MO1]